MTNPEMSAPMLALYLRRIRLTRSVPGLYALADEIDREFPDDEATPRLLAAIAVSVERLAGRTGGLIAVSTATGSFFRVRT